MRRRKVAQSSPYFRLVGFLILFIGLFATTEVTAQQINFHWDPEDPRIGLEAGLYDAGEAAKNMELLASYPRPEEFQNPNNPGDLNYANSDIAFQGDYAFVGSFHGFMIYDISDPSDPQLEVAVECPGGQGDMSVYGDLLFMSVEQTRGRIDCGVEGTSGPVDEERFRGVRIFDISDLSNPTQVAAVQTCRGSHTHTLLDSPNDDENLYVYNQGTSIVRPDAELEGCSDLPPEEDPETSLFQIEVIQVPLDAPERAQIVSEPRVFADEETGRIDGLWPGGEHGEGTQRSRQTNQCHDITTFPEIGLAAGACSGNGIILDISDPANPVRINEVVDENFAYWHSALFSNDGSKVIFTDEWGGGTAPRCQSTDPAEWGANAIFRLEDNELKHGSYYKLPVPQKAVENCVAHNGSLIPVPGRDIKVQAWYQGGISVFDFTDPEDPQEIAFFDRGPISDEQLYTAGHWSAYWYNGNIYATEIARGFEIFELQANDYLTQNELDAAKLIAWDEHNPMHQSTIEWPAHISVARAYLDQLQRDRGFGDLNASRVRAELDRIEEMAESDEKQEALADLASRLERDATGNARDPERVSALAETIQGMAGDTQAAE